MPPYRILLVCTGNICRSAAGQVLLTAHLREAIGELDGSFEVSSAGTSGLHGNPIHPATSRVLAEVGLDASDFRARRLTVSQLNTADLILTATTEHRRFIVAVHPDAAARTFTLRETARLLAGLPLLSGTTVAERGHALVRLLGARADADWSAARQDDDIADPMGGGEAAHIRAVLEVDRALRQLVKALITPPEQGAGQGR